MGRAVFSIVSLVALSVIIVTNIDNRATFNLFGWQFENLSVPVIALVSFVAGALYAFFFYLMGHFSKSRRERMAMQKQRIKSQEQVIKDKDAALKKESRTQRARVEAQPRTALPPGAVPPPGSQSPPQSRRKAKESWLKRMFGASSK